MDIQWSDKPITVPQFIERFERPQFVKIYQAETKRVQRFGELDLRQPILMYKVYRSRKVCGRAIGVDDENGRYAPTGPRIIIPENYPGWFSKMLPDGRAARFFENIGDVARAGVDMFLIQDSVLALVSCTVGLIRQMVMHGEVLKVVDVYEDDKRKYLLNEIHPDTMMYLKCLTRQGDLLFLPYSTKGRFYTISTRQSHTVDHVYLMSNLLRVSRLPVVVRIVTGPKPDIALPLSNVVLLEEVRYETVLMACIMVDNQPRLLEMDTKSVLLLLTANSDGYLQSSMFQRMHEVCASDGARWSQQMRIAHDVVPNVLPYAGQRCLSLISCISVSHAQRIDLRSRSANSLDQPPRRPLYSRLFTKRFWTLRKNKTTEHPNVQDIWRSPSEMFRLLNRNRRDSAENERKALKYVGARTINDGSEPSLDMARVIGDGSESSMDRGRYKKHSSRDRMRSKSDGLPPSMDRKMARRDGSVPPMERVRSRRYEHKPLMDRVRSRNESMPPMDRVRSRNESMPPMDRVRPRNESRPPMDRVRSRDESMPPMDRVRSRRDGNMPVLDCMRPRRDVLLMDRDYRKDDSIPSRDRLRSRKEPPRDRMPAIDGPAPFRDRMLAIDGPVPSRERVRSRRDGNERPRDRVRPRRDQSETFRRRHRIHSSDDGYATSCADVESIYNSIN